jgi:hypothetical protein
MLAVLAHLFLLCGACNAWKRPLIATRGEVIPSRNK